MLENFRSQKIIWDRANKTIFEKIEANSGDSNGRKLVVQVINQGVTENLLGTTLSLGWKYRKGAKGLDAFDVVDASKGIFEIYYTTEMLSNIGNIGASLILIDSTGRIESSTFTISVTPSTVDDESVESENSFTALTEALVKVNEYQSDIDGIKQNLVDESNQLITTEKAELDALQLDYAERAEALEETYAPRLTEVTAQLVDKANGKDVFVEGYIPPIELNLEDFSGYNEPYHPSVLYIPEGFSGYKYWLVQSPYPIAPVGMRRDRFEVPVVYKSNDGKDFTVVANPLDDLTQTEIARGDYMSDPHLVYKKDANTLEVWYRHTKIEGGTWTSIVRKTTQDGENWTAKEEMVVPKLSTAVDFMRSPAFIWDNINKIYRAWYQNDHGLYYSTSPDGKTWSNQVSLTLDRPHACWHLDVAEYDGKYHLLSYSKIKEEIAYYHSENGIDFTFSKIILSINDGNNLYGNGLYRAVSLKDENGQIRVYTSADKSNDKTAVLLLIAPTMEEIVSSPKINGNNVSINGQPLTQSRLIVESATNAFTVKNKYTDFPMGYITKTIITNDFVEGTPNGVGGLLTTDYTSGLSMGEHNSRNLVFQTLNERPSAGQRSRTYTRNTTVDPITGVTDWTAFKEEGAESAGGVSDGYAVVGMSTNKVSTATLSSLEFDTLTHVGTPLVKLVNRKITFIKKGNYVIFVKVVFEANPTGTRLIRLNGLSESRANATITQNTVLETNTVMGANADGVYDILVSQTSGGNLDVIGGSSFATQIRIYRIS